MLVRLCSKSFKLGFSSTWTENFQIYKLGLEKAEEPEITCQHLLEKAREFQKNICFCFTDYTKALNVWITVNCGKFLKWWEYQTILPACLEIYAGKEATVRTRHGTTIWFQIGKGVRQGCVLSPAYLTYMQSTSWEMPGYMKHKLESRLPGEISITSDMQMTPPLWQKAKKN